MSSPQADAQAAMDLFSLIAVGPPQPGDLPWNNNTSGESSSLVEPSTPASPTTLNSLQNSGAAPAESTGMRRIPSLNKFGADPKAGGPSVLSMRSGPVDVPPTQPTTDNGGAPLVAPQVVEVSGHSRSNGTALSSST